MNRLTSVILQPAMMGLGVSVFLYGYNQNLETYNYFAHIPFWIAVLRPSGIMWKEKFLKQINKDVFPQQMKNYREMYLSSKNAILYDALFNHLVYHSGISVALIIYLYSFQKLGKKFSLFGQQKDTKNNNSLLQILKNIGLSLLKARIFFASASILSEYWLTYFSLQKKGQNFSLTPQMKRFLLLKEVILNISWQGFILKQFYRGFLYQKQLVRTQTQTQNI